MTAGLPDCLLLIYNDSLAGILPFIFSFKRPLYKGSSVGRWVGNVGIWDVKV